MLREELIELAREANIFNIMKKYFPYKKTLLKATNSSSSSAPFTSTTSSYEQNNEYFSYYKNFKDNMEIDEDNRQINNKKDEDLVEDDYDDDDENERKSIEDFNYFLSIINKLNDDDFFYFFSDISTSSQLFSSLSRLSSSGLLTKKNDDDYLLDSIILYGYQQSILSLYYQEQEETNRENNLDVNIDDYKKTLNQENDYFSLLSSISILFKMIVNLTYIIKILNFCKKSLNEYGLANTGLGLRILSFIGIKYSFRYHFFIENEKELLNIYNNDTNNNENNNQHMEIDTDIIEKDQKLDGKNENDNEENKDFINFVSFSSLSNHSDDILNYLTLNLNDNNSINLNIYTKLSKISFFNSFLIKRISNIQNLSSKAQILLNFQSFSYFYQFLIHLLCRESNDLKINFLSLLLRLFSLFIQCDRGSLVIYKTLSGLLPSPLDYVLDPPLPLKELWSGIYSLEDERLSSIYNDTFSFSDFSGTSTTTSNPSSTSSSPSTTFSSFFSSISSSPSLNTQTSRKFISKYFLLPLLNSLGDNILLPLANERNQGPGPSIIKNKKLINSSSIKSEFILDSILKGQNLINTQQFKLNFYHFKEKLRWKFQLNSSKLKIFDLIEQIYFFFLFFYTEIIYKNDIVSLYFFIYVLYSFSFPFSFFLFYLLGIFLTIIFYFLARPRSRSMSFRAPI